MEISYGWLSLLPPIVAIVLALLTKEVISSLLLGVLAGGLILSKGNILVMFETVFTLMGEKVGSNGLMLIFLALLGSLVMVMNQAGGSFAYGQWAGKRIKTKTSAKLATSILGMLIFIDDYFNCLTVGAVMKPIIDQNNISRAKFAYIIDSTAAPICIIAPVSSWAASVVATIGNAGVENPMNVFLSTIPLNLYAILTIICVIYFCFAKYDIGPMNRYIEHDSSRDVAADNVGYEHSENGKVIDLVLPVVVLIATTVFFMLRTGGYFNGEGISLSAAFGDASVSLSLVIGSVIGLVCAFILYIPRKLVSFRSFMEGIVEGAKSMVGAIFILSLAWTVGGITSAEYLNTGGFIAQQISAIDLPIWIFPSIIFAVAAFLAFSTGTAWGTFGILVPIMVPIVVSMDVIELPMVLAAIFSGSVFGDHCSPISDTTILSSAGSGCKHIEHVSTQLPYAMVNAVATIIGFIVGGITNNVWLTLGTGIVALFILLAIAKRVTMKKYIPQ